MPNAYGREKIRHSVYPCFFVKSLDEKNCIFFGICYETSMITREQTSEWLYLWNGNMYRWRNRKRGRLLTRAEINSSSLRPPQGYCGKNDEQKIWLYLGCDETSPDESGQKQKIINIWKIWWLQNQVVPKIIINTKYGKD